MSDIVQNRRASYDYSFEDKFEAGIMLTGTEIKSIRDGNVQLSDSYGVILENELWLLNSYIGQYPCASMTNHEPTRTRKLLLHRYEINKIQSQIKLKGYSLIPTRMYYAKGRVKVELALGKGKKNYDKRQSLREKDAKREIDRELKR